MNIKVKQEGDGEGDETTGFNANKDELYEKAIDVVVETQRGSLSMLQRSLGIGYGRAARLVDFMAEDGYVGPYNGSKSREVLLTASTWAAIKSGGGTETSAAASSNAVIQADDKPISTAEGILQDILGEADANEKPKVVPKPLKPLPKVSAVRSVQTSASTSPALAEPEEEVEDEEYEEEEYEVEAEGDEDEYEYVYEDEDEDDEAEEEGDEELEDDEEYEYVDEEYDEDEYEDVE